MGFVNFFIMSFSENAGNAEPKLSEAQIAQERQGVLNDAREERDTLDLQINSICRKDLVSNFRQKALQNGDEVYLSYLDRQDLTPALQDLNTNPSSENDICQFSHGDLDHSVFNSLDMAIQDLRGTLFQEGTKSIALLESGQVITKELLPMNTLVLSGIPANDGFVVNVELDLMNGNENALPYEVRISSSSYHKTGATLDKRKVISAIAQAIKQNVNRDKYVAEGYIWKILEGFVDRNG